MIDEVLDDSVDVVALTADIVSAYVSNNPLPAGDLTGLIETVNHALQGLGAPRMKQAEALVPAVPVKNSITPDYLISLEDGKTYKTLRRHLTTRGLTPDAYRAKWGLHSNYPMVAPNYSDARSALAKRIGLGRMRTNTEAVAEPKRGRGRPKKVS